MFYEEYSKLVLLRSTSPACNNLRKRIVAREPAEGPFRSPISNSSLCFWCPSLRTSQPQQFKIRLPFTRPVVERGDVKNVIVEMTRASATAS